ncbi:putative aarF domain-containing protein kinase At1g71810, chloroplastic isoform X1 [Silene latifolia]|uniref:putative aarF domain-containing protein kinase At1g71810, chloroplastic isoform X1 n=1 Tax=Silene latifolia TaxID=37657 RepID=UPI003D787723
MSLLLRPPALPLIHPQTSTLSPKLGRVNSPVLPRTSLRRFKLTAFSSSNDVDTFTQNSGYLFQLTESEAESLSEYDIAKIGSIYRKKPFILVRRLIQIVTTLGKWFGLRYVDGLMDRADSMFEIRAAELRKILVELGPAYVKIAQAISSRSDLIPPSYLEQLSVLQDRITPFSSDVAFSTIEQELGMTLDKMFSEISPEPVAAASLGQVYQARLRTNGQVVAVKVQRPGVKAAISLDIYILRFLAGIIRRARKLNTDLQAVVDEWASSLFREMDYRKEAKNGLKFRELYGGLPDVVVPHMYIEKTTPRVLIMEWIEGQKLAEVKDLYLVEVGVYCSFNQLLEYGFYHADPHPGNLLRTYDGKLAYLDFGMMGEFKEELRDGFIEACLHLVNRDFKALATDFVTLGLLPPTAEKEAVTNALTGVFKNAVSKGVRNISFGDLSGELGITMYKFKFRIPSYFSLVIRSLAVLEGIAINFDPNYKVLGSTYPYIAKKVLTGNSPKLVSSLQSLLYEDGVFRIDRLESLLTEMQRAKIGNALVKKDELDTRLDAKDILSFTLAKQGSFVREIFLEETAKGLDALGLATLNSITSASIASIPFTVPFLAYQMTEEDIINLRNFQRLVQLVSGSEGPRIETEKINDHQSQRSALQEIPQLLNQLPTTWELQPILASVNELPLEEQQRLYSLPTEVLARLFSRMVARTIRRYFL